MTTLLLTLTLVTGAEPQPPVPTTPKVEIPKLVDGPAPLKPLSSQSPGVAPVLASPAVPSQPSLGLPGVPRANVDLRVKECERKPDIPGGAAADALGRPHKWLVVEDPFGNTVHAPGLGNKRGVPGANGQSSPDWPLSKTFIRDHTGEIPRTCRPLPAVDPFCLISKTPYGQYEGRWLPFANDCNSFSQRIISDCRLPHLGASPLTNTQPTTVWDKPSLMPQLDAPPKYRLGVDLNLPKSARGLTAPSQTSPAARPAWHPPMATPKPMSVPSQTGPKAH